MNIKATVLLFAVVAVCTVTMIQSRMTRNTDNDEDNYPSNNQRRDTDDNDNDDGDSREWSNTQRSDRNDNDNDDDDRSTRYPSNNQRGDRDDNDNDKDYRSTKSPSNNQRGDRDDNDNDNDYRSTTYPSNNQRGDRDDNDNDNDYRSTKYPSNNQRGDRDGNDNDNDYRSTKYPSNNQRACFAVDLAFSVDASGSIVRENWSRVTALINRAIAGMEISPSCARVSVVTFGNAATLQFDLLAHDNAASLHRAIAGLGMLNQSRNLADGISTVRSDVFQDYYGDRQDIPNVCVLITDGNSGLDKQFTLAEAARAKADGISLLVIGIGRKVRMSELSLIADSSSHAIHLNDFEDLNCDAALQRLTDAMQGFKQTPAPNTRSTIATHPRQSTTTTTYPRQSTTTTTYPRQSTTTTTYPRQSTTTTTHPIQSTTTTMAQPTTTKTVSTSFSWQCSFENATGRGSLCGMTQPSSDNFDWTLKSGRTPSSQTGPNSAYGGSGYYIFIEASNPRRMNDKAMIMLPSFNEDGDYCLSFYYNMNGFHINTLQVVNRHSSGLLVNLWMKKHHQGSQWKAAQVTASLHSSDQLAFIGIRGHEYSGDIAVDSISVRKGIC